MSARRKAICDREQARKREITVAAHEVRTMAIDGKHGVKRVAEGLDEYRHAGLDIIGLQETRREGQSQFQQADYVVYCSGACGVKGGGKNGLGGVGLPSERDHHASCRTPTGINQRTTPEGDLEVARFCECCLVRVCVCVW